MVTICYGISFLIRGNVRQIICFDLHGFVSHYLHHLLYRNILFLGILSITRSKSSWILYAKVLARLSTRHQLKERPQKFFAFSASPRKKRERVNGKWVYSWEIWQIGGLGRLSLPCIYVFFWGQTCGSQSTGYFALISNRFFRGPPLVKMPDCKIRQMKCWERPEIRENQSSVETDFSASDI